MAQHLAPRKPVDTAERARIKAWLWSDPTLTVHAVVAEAHLPGMSQRLANLPTTEAECLLPGALDPAAQLAAPWLVRLPREAGFTDWLLFETAATSPRRWLAMRSGVPLLRLRQHLRELHDLPGLNRRPGRDALRTTDPAVLSALLPGFDRAGLAAFFGPVHSFVWPDDTGWTGFARGPAGRLLPQTLAGAEGGR